jgi:hypothetical protein
VVRAEGAPRRATASKSALADLDIQPSEIGKPDFGLGRGRILRGSLTLAPQDDGIILASCPASCRASRL